MTALVDFRDLTCLLGGRLVLDGIEFQVAHREAVALLGCSGSGKSTLLRVIAGLQIPDKGEVRIDGEPASRNGRLLVPSHRRGIAMLFQDLALWPNLTVAGNVGLGLSGLRLSSKESRQRIARALELCGISDLADRRPGTLSGGQQQRTALARALAVRPQLLLLDEPLGGLDLITKQSLLRQIADLKSQFGFAVVLVTHDPIEVRELATSLAVLENGHIVERVPLEDITETPRSALGKALVRALRDIAGEG